MDLKETLQGHPEVFFVDSLAPVEDARLMGDRPGRFHYREAFEYLIETGCNTAHFYYNHYNPLEPFCYFRNHVIVDFPRFTQEALISNGVLDRIKLGEKLIGAALKSKDFNAFFELLDSRLALLSFIEYYPVLTSADRYSIFWRLYSRCNWRLDTFPREFIKDITNHIKKKPLPVTLDEYGCFEAYHGSADGEKSANEAFSWTLDINTAIYRATRHGRRGRIFKARIPVRKILAYLPWKKEKEIIVFPGTATNIETLHFTSLKSYVQRLKREGLWELYHHYAKGIKPEYFWKPSGLHGLAHTRNVLFFSILLAHLLKTESTDLRLLAISALYHDIGRKNDNFDPLHGKASYKKANRMGLLPSDKEEKNIVRFLIEAHCINDTEAYNLLPGYPIKDKDRARMLIDIFKDADGLDRIRIMDLDVRQLRTKKAWHLLLAARELLVANILK